MFLRSGALLLIAEEAALMIQNRTIESVNELTEKGKLKVKPFMPSLLERLDILDYRSQTRLDWLY